MTRAMRAAPTSDKRAARVARVTAGRIVEEQIHEATLARDGFTLQCRKGRWTLALAAGVTARIIDRKVEGPAEIPLDPDARGQIGAEHLFQLVAPAPRTSAALPASVIASERVDVRFAAVVAVSLLAHFGFVSAAQADWLDPVVIDDAEEVSLITETPVRPQVQVEEKTSPSGEPVVAANAPSKTAGPAEKKSPAPAKPQGPSFSALDDKLDQLGLSTIASLGQGPAKSKLLRDPNAADGSLDDLAKKNAGVEADGPKLKSDPGGVGPIKADGKLSDIGDTKSKTPVVDNKPMTEPTYKPNEPAIAPANGVPPKDANAVIAKNRWKFKACYTKELGANSDAQGTVRVTVTVSPEGDVIAANGVSPDLSPSVVSCVESAFKGMKFGTDDNKTTFGVPIVFSKTNK